MRLLINTPRRRPKISKPLGQIGWHVLQRCVKFKLALRDPISGLARWLALQHLDDPYTVEEAFRTPGGLLGRQETSRMPRTCRLVLPRAPALSSPGRLLRFSLRPSRLAAPKLR